MRQLALDLQLNASSTFANFVPGSANQALVDYLQQPQGPLLLYGKTGEGVTHLLQATCHLTFPALYLPLRQYHYFQPEILQGAERLKLLAVDDIDRIAGNVLWEEALFCAFNDAVAADTRLLFATHTPLAQLTFVLPDLHSRVQSMLYLTLQPLSDEDKLQVLSEQAQRRGFELSSEVARYLIHHASRDMGALLGLLEQLDHLSLQTQRRITIPLVKTLLIPSV